MTSTRQTPDIGKPATKNEILPTAEASPNERLLAAYLHDRIEAEEECYLKSRFIADDIDLSPKQIGLFMSQLQDRETNISIEKWSYTNGTTWRVCSE